MLKMRLKTPLGLWQTNSQTTEACICLAIITLDVKGLSFPIKRQRLAERILKTIQLYDVYKSLMLHQRHKSAESERMERDTALQIIIKS